MAALEAMRRLEEANMRARDAWNKAEDSAEALEEAHKAGEEADRAWCNSIRANKVAEFYSCMLAEAYDDDVIEVDVNPDDEEWREEWRKVDASADEVKKNQIKLSKKKSHS